MLHLATNIRYVFGCHNWIDKRCKQQRILDLELVQPPPIQQADWRISQVLPQYNRAVSPFRPRFDVNSPHSSPTSERSRQTPRRSPQRLSFQQDQIASDVHQQGKRQVQPQIYAQPQAPVAIPDARLDVHQKLQRDFEHYKRLGQQKSLAAPTRRQSNYAAEASSDNDRDIGVPSKRLQAAQSIARRTQLRHQQTADVVPRFDSMQHWSPAKQPWGQSAEAADSMQYRVQAKQPLAQPDVQPVDVADREQYVDVSQPNTDANAGYAGSRSYNQESVQQSVVDPRQYMRSTARMQAVAASAPPMTRSRRSGSPSRRSSPSRFANRGDRPVTPPGLAKSQRIAAWRV